jgi:hypothetical protein
VVSFAWFAGVIVALLAVVALTVLWTPGRERRALLRKPPHDPREDARHQAEGPPESKDAGPSGGGLAADGPASPGRESAWSGATEFAR